MGAHHADLSQATLHLDISQPRSWPSIPHPRHVDATWGWGGSGFDMTMALYCMLGRKCQGEVWARFPRVPQKDGA